MICPPTFGMYEVAARIQGADVVEVPLDRERGFALDEAAIIERWQPDAKIVFLCSPNNPTGNLLDEAVIERLVARLQRQALVVVDEAYVEFSGVEASPACWSIPTTSSCCARCRRPTRSPARAAARCSASPTSSGCCAGSFRRMPCPPRRSKRPSGHSSRRSSPLRARDSSSSLPSASGWPRSCAPQPSLRRSGRAMPISCWSMPDADQAFRSRHRQGPAGPRLSATGRPRELPAHLDRHAGAERAPAPRMSVRMSAPVKVPVRRSRRHAGRGAARRTGRQPRQDPPHARRDPGAARAATRRVRARDGDQPGRTRHARAFPRPTFVPRRISSWSSSASQGIRFDAVFICPHFAADGCECRKPKLGLLTDWLASYPLDRAASVVIGDRDTDLELARNLGIAGLRVRRDGATAGVMGSDCTRVSRGLNGGAGLPAQAGNRSTCVDLDRKGRSRSPPASASSITCSSRSRGMAASRCS